ncbi:MAG: hypothetical protein CMM62_00905 [Rhodospirillaceae bacterium]|nr:hypothetical protein [Rhodospirillaceae bacterium]MAX61881.1 hypothetical protein [Rhodospirillaceae bacterium]|tara:strand:- start:436 stop:708 length:273 start_codon:yes stop_codon:yes gene_type:complete
MSDKDLEPNVVSLDQHRTEERLDWTLLWLPPNMVPFIRRDAEAAGLSVEEYLNAQFLAYLEAFYEEELTGIDGAQLPLFRPSRILREVKS